METNYGIYPTVYSTVAYTIFFWGGGSELMIYAMLSFGTPLTIMQRKPHMITYLTLKLNALRLNFKQMTHVILKHKISIAITEGKYSSSVLSLVIIKNKHD